MLTLLVVTALIVAGVGAYAYVTSHPKPADEPLPTYVEEVVEHIPEQVVEEAKEVVAEVKKVVKRKPRAKKTEATK